MIKPLIPHQVLSNMLPLHLRYTYMTACDGERYGTGTEKLMQSSAFLYSFVCACHDWKTCERIA